MIGTTFGSTPRKKPNHRNRRKPTPGQGFSPVSNSGLKRSGIALGLMCILAMFLGGLFLGYRWAVTTETFALSEIEVTGIQHLSYGDVLTAGDVTLGRNCLDLNVTRVQSRLAKNPWVKSVAVRRELPDKLIIEIEEKKAAYWSIFGDRIYYADELGGLITALTPGDFTSLPVLDAPNKLRGTLYKLPEMITRLEASGLNVKTSHLTSLRVMETGELELLLDHPGLTLRFGMNDYLTHLERMEKV
ncbi:MAG: FtsQ-type POTRA domain-containing protein, partial [Proteobacteria bacterium]|nr:FtsQ-type POTRA domain-containing protein [Pseudomonadota bacterium]